MVCIRTGIPCRPKAVHPAGNCGFSRRSRARPASSLASLIISWSVFKHCCTEDPYPRSEDITVGISDFRLNRLRVNRLSYSVKNEQVLGMRQLLVLVPLGSSTANATINRIPSVCIVSKFGLCGIWMKSEYMTSNGFDPRSSSRMIGLLTTVFQLMTGKYRKTVPENIAQTKFFLHYVVKFL